MGSTPSRGELRRLRRAVWGEPVFARHARHCRRERVQQWSSSVFIGLGALVAVAGLIPNAGATQPSPGHKVTLCHRTGSYKNPYVEITTDIAAVTHKGHDGHDGPVFFASIPKHEKWGDIIPPFDFGPGRRYAGKNWPSGQPILNNGCNAPVSPPPPTTPPTTLAPPTTNAGVTTTTQVPPGSTVPTSVPGATTTLPNGPTTTVGVTTTSTPGSVTTLGNGTTTTHPGTVSSTQPANTTSSEVGAVTTIAPSHSGPLPFTGGNPGGNLIVGCVLIAVGLALRPRRRTTDWR